MKNIYHKETFDRIPEERRNRIIDVAIKEFAYKGFDNANINKIASDAGVSVGSIYKYFNTKDDLFLTCVHIGVTTLEKVLNDILNSNDDLFIKIEKIIRVIQSHSRSQKDLIVLYNEMTSESNSELTWKLSSEMETISANVYSSLIRQAQDNGLVNKNISAGLFAFFLDNILMMLQFSYGCEYYRERFKIYAGNDILDNDDLVVNQLLMFLKAAFK